MSVLVGLEPILVEIDPLAPDGFPQASLAVNERSVYWEPVSWLVREWWVPIEDEL